MMSIVAASGPGPALATMGNHWVRDPAMTARSGRQQHAFHSGTQRPPARVCDRWALGRHLSRGYDSGAWTDGDGRIGRAHLTEGGPGHDGEGTNGGDAFFANAPNSAGNSLPQVHIRPETRAGGYGTEARLDRDRGTRGGRWPRRGPAMAVLERRPGRCPERKRRNSGISTKTLWTVLRSAWRQAGTPERRPRGITRSGPAITPRPGLVAELCSQMRATTLCNSLPPAGPGPRHLSRGMTRGTGRTATAAPAWGRWPGRRPAMTMTAGKVAACFSQERAATPYDGPQTTRIRPRTLA